MATSAILDISPLGFQWKTLDPFLFCVHHLDHYPVGNGRGGPDASLLGRSLGYDFSIKDGWRMYHGREVPGFPMHPHRGFETVTVVRKGFVDHSDSLGTAGRYGQGDVQWMTAGKGVQHSEIFPLLSRTGPNTLELFQIWLNLPAAKKFADPNYVMFWSEDIPRILHKHADGSSVEEEQITSEGLKPPADSWAANPENEVAIRILTISKNGKYRLAPASAGINRAIYFYEGSGLQVDAKLIPDYHSVVLRSDMEIELLAGEHEVRVLLLQGRPIAEPVYQYGPFVMSSRQEIDDAYNDFQATRFGGWPWESPEPVHDLKLGRFAKYADGSVDERPK